MTRSLVRVIALAALLLGLAASPAHAAGELGLSPDGQAWTGQLPEPLFDPAVRWVPGDRREAQFYVRNQAAEGGTLTIAVLSQDPDRLLRDQHLQLSARVGSERWVDLAPPGESIRLNEAALPADAVRKVEVHARFDFAAGNHTQQDTVALDFTVTLSGVDSTPVPDDPNAPADPASPVNPNAPVNPNPPVTPDAPAVVTGPVGWPDSRLDSDLPGTGAPPLGWWVVAAGTAIGVGLALVKRRRREEAGHDASH